MSLSTYLPACQKKPFLWCTITPSVESSDIPDIIASIRPSVVAIEVASTVRIEPRLVTQRGAGTGVVLTSTRSPRSRWR